ncbi:ABC transporter permease [Nonomuraea jiangxiensis]|uniref:Putative ABC transport system permease protein n=1 Tax=Nonomuraea jiangxiensis TaxID=633440 RepID=A0A1G9I734_9ACTN|nr:ABC transporter permease [Nonomuraea jiangxiensis]SDL21041.1 putative ABC transport system permease protein [Nonomuraea jiangxiensis]
MTATDRPRTFPGTPATSGSDIGLSRLRAADLIPVATGGLRTRRVRVLLSMLGIAIGISAVVAVLGITRSSQADLLARLDRLGTNLLTVVNGSNLSDAEVPLPATATTTIGHTEGVEAVAPTAELAGVGVYRSDKIPPQITGGLSVRAADSSLVSTLGADMLAGTYLNEATSRYPTTVLGHTAAETLGITDLSGAPRVWLGGRWYTVIGILRPIELASEINRSALIGFPVAARDFAYNDRPSRIYVRSQTERTLEVFEVLARAANPKNPNEVAVSRPSDVLTARLEVANATTTMFVGLGAVALLVGGIGIANVMVISVLERRSEIGLRRALGAARRHVAAQFVVESFLLGTAGGVAGVLVGVTVTYGMAVHLGWQVIIPPAAMSAGLGTAMAIGVLSGIYPALRAASMPPTQALRTS